MIFGRRKQADQQAPEQEARIDEQVAARDDVTASEQADDVDVEQTDLASPAGADADVEEADEDIAADDVAHDDDEADEDADEDDDDQWTALDESKDWRYDGPFDLSEVDLSADAEMGIERVDLGSLVVTPEEEVAVQLQLQQETGQVQALVAMHQNSGLEVALFAAPSKSSMLTEVREGLIQASQEVGGTIDLAEGPFGTEIRRLLPLEGPDGQTYLHPSRIWMVQGPRWLLRGVLMGEAGMQDNLQGSAGVLLEFFRNIVVNRDTTPRVPGDLVLLSLPPGVTLEETEMPEGEESPEGLGDADAAPIEAGESEEPQVEQGGTAPRG